MYKTKNKLFIFKIMLIASLSPVIFKLIIKDFNPNGSLAYLQKMVKTPSFYGSIKVCDRL